ncbi:MAG: hypothetical protein IPF92_21775 [Myxococcales bacterium]|nr:hypothetical protein [Myxococcales bacterium]
MTEFWAALRVAARLPSDDGAKPTQLLASMELGGGAPSSGPRSESTIVDAIEAESERTALGIGPDLGGPAAPAARPEPPMTARLGPAPDAARAAAPSGVATFLGQGPAPPSVHEPGVQGGPRPAHVPSADATPWSPPAPQPPPAPPVAAPPVAAPPVAEARPRPPAAHSATLAMSSRPSLEPPQPVLHATRPPAHSATQPPAHSAAHPTAPQPTSQGAMAASAGHAPRSGAGAGPAGPLAATMAMPASATAAALGARSSSLPHAPAQAATQALAVVPPGGVASHASQVSHAPRESEGGQRAAVSVGRASAPAWGPALPPQPFVPAEPAAVVEEPVEVPKSRAGLLVVGAVVVAALLGLGIFLGLRVSKPPAHVEPDAASIFAVPDAATSPPSSAPSSATAEPSAVPAASVPAPSATAEPSADPSARAPRGVDARRPRPDHADHADNTPTTKPSAAPVGPGAFSPSVARAKLDAANGVLVICKRAGGPSGRGSAAVTFAPPGT